MTLQSTTSSTSSLGSSTRTSSGTCASKDSSTVQLTATPSYRLSSCRMGSLWNLMTLWSTWLSSTTTILSAPRYLTYLCSQFTPTWWGVISLILKILSSRLTMPQALCRTTIHPQRCSTFSKYSSTRTQAQSLRFKRKTSRRLKANCWKERKAK